MIALLLLQRNARVRALLAAAYCSIRIEGKFLKGRWTSLLLACAPLAAAVCSGPASADALDTFNLSAGYSTQTDSNLFRLSPSSAVPSSGTKSERIDTTTLGASIDKSYSLQNIRINATALDYKYRTNDYLSFTTLNYDAAWRWAVTPRIRGNIVSEKRTSLNNFSDFRNVSARNLRTVSSSRIDAEGELAAAWRVFGGFQRSRNTNDLPVVQEGDDQVTSTYVGLRYVFPSDNFLSYRLREGTGDYFNRIPTPGSLLPTSLKEEEQEVRMFWKITGKTTVVARLAHIARTHADLPIRDYSGPIGDVSLSWAATGKINLVAALGRDLSTYQTNTSSFVSANRFSLAPTWRMSDHTSLRAAYQYAQLNYQGPLPSATPVLERKDTERTVQLSVNWRPRDALALGLSLQNTRRGSSSPGFDYKFNTATLTALVTF
ncbi:hypothetical protein RD110_10135 [Rhodoferax koreense]|uniref:Exosortase B-associated extracellular polysaccharide biosynthesis transporter EpsL n=1 Tax=Rhodoferax koreensis TaxID=1842727 RepID=A0A1P8JUS8_9BURK|nr:XrtB/PEP-CTERM-associated polysaccharide biosynthesis outer membrane protein EpsL [Rhodoferax koreense]APW37503.1 hypothetical protein RD110_10135 [Rhodoferax koreense]